MSEVKNEDLFLVRRDVRCINCNHKGAIQSYGTYYPEGLGDKVDDYGKIARPYMDNYRYEPYMDRTMGFGGIIPYSCTNCGSVGLVDVDGLEGYHKAFISIKE